MAKDTGGKKLQSQTRDVKVEIIFFTNYKFQAPKKPFDDSLSLIFRFSGKVHQRSKVGNQNPLLTNDSLRTHKKKKKIK